MNNSTNLAVQANPEIEIKPLRVALLDDDMMFGLILSRYAERYNVSISIYTNPNEYIKAISKFEYDVSLIDYYLEEDIGTRYANIKEKLPVVLTSRDSLPGEICDANTKNIRGFVQKNGNFVSIIERLVYAFYHHKNEEKYDATYSY